MIGRTVSHYSIVARLGAGGMGEVFLAEDLVLHRKVALKILPAEVVNDADRLRRFKREAEAASTLSHPNIVMVHEIGVKDDVHFIAMEYVEGETLRQRLGRGRPPIPETLDIAIQLVTALTAAHKAGIVHRDLKPENVIVREDGYVKLLDFGLAKVMRPERVDTVGASPTVSLATVTGRMLGTVQYMSPEQARGRLLDARSDLFSLGAVLYELCAGRPPFAGDTAPDVIAALLTRDPHRLESVPAELERIVFKALRKEPDQRFQVAQDMLIDLKALRESLTIGRSHSSDRPGIASARPLQRRRQLHRSSRWLLAVAALLIVPVVAWWMRPWIRSGPAPGSAPAALTIVRLSSSGNAVAAAVSADAKYVAYAAGNDSEQSLWLRQISLARNIVVVPPAPVRFWSVTFSPDGNFIYYIVVPHGAISGGTLHRIPTLGGGSRKVAEDVSSPISLTPDGQRLAFLRIRPGAKDLALVVLGSDGGAERIIASLPPTGFVPEYGPAWSPDGRKIACLDAEADTTGNIASRVIALDADGATRETFTSTSLYFVRQLTWYPDGTGVLLVGQDQPSAYSPQIWQVSYPSGAVRQLTSQVESFETVSLDGTATLMVAVQRSVSSSIWLSSVGDAPRAIELPSSAGAMEGKAGLGWTRSGRLVYSSFVSGNWVLLSSDADGANVKQLTFGAGGDQDPVATRDDRTLVFASNRGRSRNIWAMDLDGGNVRRLTTGYLDWLPYPSADSKSAFYASVAGGIRTIWRAGIDVASPTQVSTVPCDNPAVSFDGRFVACYSAPQLPPSPPHILILPVAGGAPAQVLTASPTLDPQAPFLRWMPDDRALAYVDTRGGVSNIRTQPLDGGSARELTDFTTQRIYKFDIRADGARVVSARGAVASDVVLLRNFH
jgi:Tol biopolymer transport system component